MVIVLRAEDSPEAKFTVVFYAEFTSAITLPRACQLEVSLFRLTFIQTRKQTNHRVSSGDIHNQKTVTVTYGHRSQNTRDPVRSPIFKLRTGRLVLRWVTTWESRLLYVLLFGSTSKYSHCPHCMSYMFSVCSGWEFDVLMLSRWAIVYTHRAMLPAPWRLQSSCRSTLRRPLSPLHSQQLDLPADDHRPPVPF